MDHAVLVIVFNDADFEYGTAACRADHHCEVIDGNGAQWVAQRMEDVGVTILHSPVGRSRR